MTCDRTPEMHRYHDGELSPGDREAVEAHVRVCVACRETLAELGRLSSLLSAASPAVLSDEAVERLYQYRSAARERGILRLAGWMTATAAAILVAALLTRPAGRAEIVSRPAIWETVAVTPSIQASAEANLDLVVLAQWMADDLSAGEGW